MGMKRWRGRSCFASEIPLQGGMGGGCQSSLGLSRAYPDAQLLLMEETLEGPDRGEVRWWLCSPNGTGLLNSAPLVLDRIQKVLKFIFKCQQYKTSPFRIHSMQIYVIILLSPTHAQSKIPLYPAGLFLILHIHIFYQLEKSTSNSLN